MLSEEESLKKILYNPFLRQKFLNDSDKYFNSYTKEEYVEKLYDLILHEIDNMNKDTFDIELIIQWFKCILKEKYLNDVYLFYYDPLSEKLRDKYYQLGVNIDPFINYFHQTLESTVNTENYVKCINKYIQNAKNGYVYGEEFNKYVFALNYVDDMEEENFKYIYNRILDFKEHILHDDIYQNFFLRFSKYVAKEFGLKNVKFKLVNISSDNLGIHGGQNVNGEIIHNIVYNKNKINEKYILDNIRTLFHEITHVIQFYETDRMYRLDKLKQLEDIILRLDDEKYYKDNYEIFSPEIEANINSYVYLTQILKAYAPGTYLMKNEEISDKIFEQQLKDIDYSRISKYKDSNSLQTSFTAFLKNHPGYIENEAGPDDKEVLLQVYNIDGTTRTPDYYFKQKEIIMNELEKTAPYEKEKINFLNQKLDFYSSVLDTFEYNIQDLKRNYIALNNYMPTDIKLSEEVKQYKNRLINQLLYYEQSQKLESKVIIDGIKK